MNREQLTDGWGYAEDFVVGDRWRHSRGKTITDFETQTLSLLVMNTSQGHFNADWTSSWEFGPVPLTFGGIVASIVIGLASEDTAEHAVRELGMEKIVFPARTVSGDTLYAATEVLDVTGDDNADAAVVRFRHFGFNQREETVCEIERSVLIRRRPGT